MRDEDNLKISGLIDGELSYDETLVLLKKIQADEALKIKMSRYQAISQALKTDQFIQVKPDFSNRVFQEIHREPTYLLPTLKPQPASQPQTNQTRRKTMFALAASTVAAAVFVGQNLRDTPAANNYPTITAMSMSPQQPPSSFSQPEKSKQNKRQPLNAQFNDYLQAHNNSVYTNGEAMFHPYAKVTSYDQR
jgi:sigma-E factor negative regulatory protein RseA